MRELTAMFCKEVYDALTTDMLSFERTAVKEKIQDLAIRNCERSNIKDCVGFFYKSETYDRAPYHNRWAHRAPLYPEYHAEMNQYLIDLIDLRKEEAVLKNYLHKVFFKVTCFKELFLLLPDMLHADIKKYVPDGFAYSDPELTEEEVQDFLIENAKGFEAVNEYVFRRLLIN